MEVLCQGCSRQVTLIRNLDQGHKGQRFNNFDADSVLCDACKRFYCRHRKKSGNLQCNCTFGKKDSSNLCRSCRFQRCSSVIHAKEASITDNEDEDTTNNNSSLMKVDFSKLPCSVCGCSSTGYHFGAVSCEGCKGFFRRSINNSFKMTYKCKGEFASEKESDLCMESSNCRKCRFQRCLNAGMSLKEVSIGRYTRQRKAKIEAALRKHSRAGSLLNDKVCRKDKRALAKTLEDPSSNSAERDESPSSSDFDSTRQLDNLIRKSSEYFAEKSVAAAAHLATISQIRVKLTYDLSNDQIVIERVKCLEAYVKAVGQFITGLPGAKQISLHDRIALFTQSFFSISAAQLSLNFDAESQLPNHFSLDREGPAFEICSAKYGFHDIVEKYLIETGNALTESLSSLREFSLLCALLYLNPDIPDLEDPQKVRLLRRRYDLAVLDYFWNLDREGSNEIRMVKYYDLLPLFRRGASMFHTVCTDVATNHAEDRMSWTPLINQVYLETLKLNVAKPLPS